MLLAVVAQSLTGGLFFLFWVWAVLDVISMDSILVRNLPKPTWVMLVLFIPVVGSVAWLAVGRPVNAGFSAGSVRRPPTQRHDYYSNPGRHLTAAPRGPEDDPSWQSPRARPSQSAAAAAASSGDAEESLAARERKLLEREAELAKREAALADEDQDNPNADS